MHKLVVSKVDGLVIYLNCMNHNYDARMYYYGLVWQQD